MLTRLKVSGFKNLVDVDVSFGPFTCIAGANGVGKSNLMDAILFLSALADKNLLQAGLSVRDQGARNGDIRGLFHHAGDRYAEEMTFHAEMIVPAEGLDNLGQEARASSTFVEYDLVLRHKREDSLELVREELKHITQNEAEERLQFPLQRPWRESVIRNKRRTAHYVSTEGSGAGRTIKVHQDGGSSGKPQRLRAANLPRTVVSAANSAESPTVTLVQREMQSWRLLQLEPSALREPDAFAAPSQLSSNGAHLAATLHHLATAPGADPDAVYTEVANRLRELIDDVSWVSVERDDRRQLLTLIARGRDGTAHAARALSDGTLRFLALTVLSMDPASQGLICLEEPENGIHPRRIPAMLNLLGDLASDTQSETDGPLRQVIINTHSPAVAMQVPEDSLVIAKAVDAKDSERRGKALALRCLPGNWRIQAGMQACALGEMLDYLNPIPSKPAGRVVDRGDLRQYKFDFGETRR